MHYIVSRFCTVLTERMHSFNRSNTIHTCYTYDYKFVHLYMYVRRYTYMAYIRGPRAVRVRGRGASWSSRVLARAPCWPGYAEAGPVWRPCAARSRGGRGGAKTYAYVYTYINRCTYIYIYIYICIYVYQYICVYMCICIYAYTYVYMYPYGSFLVARDNQVRQLTYQRATTIIIRNIIIVITMTL